MVKTAQDIILKPVITEASMDALRHGKYTFRVMKTANKHEIKDAVEKIFGVKVAKVNTIRRHHSFVEKGNRNTCRGFKDNRFL